MALNIMRGKMAKAQKVVVYGPEGVGKSTFATRFPDPLFIDVEGSTDHYDVARTQAPKSWEELLAQVREVKQTRPCSTLIIDTADWAEALCMAHVCAKHKWASIEQPGYGQGYNQTVEEFCRLLNELSEVADAGINVVLTAHAAIRKFDQPDEAASYDRWELKLINGNKASNAAKVKEWADALLFANYKTVVEIVGDGKAAHGKARNGQKRVMHCQHHACWDAKNRWGLPDEAPFDFAQIAAFIPCTQGAKQEPAQVTAPVATAQPAPAVKTAPVVAPVVASSPPKSVATPTPTPTPTPTSAPKPAPTPTTQAAPATPPAVKPVQSITYAQDGTVVSDSAKDKPLAQPELPDYWAPALQLMERYGVSMDEVRAMSASKGFFTIDTPTTSYPEEYVSGCIVAQWPKCLDKIKAIREDAEPVPFGAPDMSKI